MNVNRANRLGGLAVVLAVSLATVGVAHAQSDNTPSNAGVVLGEIDRCNNGAAVPAAGVTVTIDGGSGGPVKTDSGGQFALNVAAGTYTVTAVADDGATAVRGYVPVEGGSAIDIGILELGGGAGGCGTDASVTAPVLPTFTPTATVAPTLEPTPPPPTATPVPPAPTATPVPDQPQPDQSQPDQSQPDTTESGG